MELIETIKRYDQQNLWVKVFEFIVQDSSYSAKKFTSSEALKDGNRFFNRYPNVLPYDHSRVLLKWEVVGNGISDYINANILTFPDNQNRYIITQSPLSNTSKHFWHMLWQEKCPIIVMLNKLEERRDTFPYFPTLRTNNIEAGNFSLLCVSENKYQTYYRREIRVTKTDMDDDCLDRSRIILHYHFIEWPDFGIPDSSDNFVEFVISVQSEYTKYLSSATCGPMVIHCSAGIGRSGTFALVEACLEQVNREKDTVELNPVNTLLDLRLCRASLIQTHDQLRFAFKSIAKGIELKHPHLLTRSKSSGRRRIKVNDGILISQNSVSQNTLSDDEEFLTTPQQSDSNNLSENVTPAKASIFKVQSSEYDHSSACKSNDPLILKQNNLH